MMKLAQVIQSAALLLALTGCGITASSSNAGYADLDSLGFSDVDQTLNLSIGPSLLKFASMHADEDPQTSQVLKGLDGVRVKTYDLVGDTQRVSTRIDNMSAKLQQQGWIPVITVREENERTLMLVKTNAEQILGLTVINCDLHEAVVINVMGNLRPGMFSPTMAALEVDAPAIELVATDAAPASDRHSDS